MTKAQHTPGPWVYDGDGFDSVSAQHCGTDGYAVFTRDQDGSFNEAVCDIAYQTDDAVAEANARLIASAPELFAVVECQAALDLDHKECGKVFRRHGWNGEQLSSWLSAKARTALAKAIAA